MSSSAYGQCDLVNQTEQPVLVLVSGTSFVTRRLSGQLFIFVYDNRRPSIQQRLASAAGE
jgi:hypothetical protein